MEPETDKQKVPRGRRKGATQHQNANSPSVVYVFIKPGDGGIPAITEVFNEQKAALMQSLVRGEPYYQLERYMAKSEFQDDGSIRTAGVAASN